MGGVTGAIVLHLKEAAEHLCLQISNATAGWATGKFGTSEFEAICYFRQRCITPELPYPQKIINHITINAGLWAKEGQTIHETIDDWSEAMIRAASQLDLPVAWNPTYPRQEDIFLREFAPGKDRIPLRALEPFYSPENQYTLCMTKGSICVVSPFADTIKSQWEKRAQLFPEGGIGGKMWLDTQELHTVKAPYGPHMTSEKMALSWSETILKAGPLAAVQSLADQVQATGARYVFVGIGALSLLLVVELKKRGLIALHTGGGTQIIFGLMGERWKYHNVISKMFNEHWVRPSEAETPSHAQSVEGACYW